MELCTFTAIFELLVLDLSFAICSYFKLSLHYTLDTL